MDVWLIIIIKNGLLNINLRTGIRQWLFLPLGRRQPGLAFPGVSHKGGLVLLGEVAAGFRHGV